MSEIWISMREKKLTDTLTLMTDTLTRVTAERDKLADELKSLRNSGVELPFVTMCQADYQGNLVDYFTETQLRDYGDRRAMAERERCARVCEQPSDEQQITDSYSEVLYKDWSECAEAIRKGE
jgi:hypothetical protein